MDFLHRKLSVLSEGDQRAIEKIDGEIAAPDNSGLALKNFLEKSGKNLVFEPFFRYGKADAGALKKARGKTLIAEAQEIDTFFINDLPPAGDILIVQKAPIGGDRALQETAAEFFAKNKIKPYLGVKNTLPNSLLIRFPKIKARMLKNALSIDNIFISNSENCSLSLGSPSSALRNYGFGEDEAREAVSLSWEDGADQGEFLGALEKIMFRYRQILSAMERE